MSSNKGQGHPNTGRSSGRFNKTGRGAGGGRSAPSRHNRNNRPQAATSKYGGLPSSPGPRSIQQQPAPAQLPRWRQVLVTPCKDKESFDVPGLAISLPKPKPKPAPTAAAASAQPPPAAAAAAGEPNNPQQVDLTSPSKSGISDQDLLQLPLGDGNANAEAQDPTNNNQEDGGQKNNSAGTDNAFPYEGDTSSDEESNAKPAADPLLLPFKQFSYEPTANKEAKQWAVDKQNEELAFSEAIKPLVPLEQLKPKLINFRNAMHGASTTIDKSTKSYQWVTDQPDYTHKCVDVKPVFQLPFGADKYPSTFMKLYTHINSQLEAKAAKFRNEATELIHKGHGIMCLQYKLDRIHIMFTHLIYEIGQYHAAYYRARNPDKDPRDDPNKVPSDIDIAITGVHTLLSSIDLDVLEYLDVNRDKLHDIFKERFQPTPAADIKHCPDVRASSYVTNTILGYIKSATVAHYNAKTTKNQEVLARACVAAKMEKNQASDAMAATDKAITAATLPTSNKTLTDAINHVVDKRLSKPRTKRPPQRTNTDKANKRRKSNSSNSQATPKQPRAANQQGTNTKTSLKRNKNKRHNTKQQE
jgi:hypothetical protein